MKCLLMGITAAVLGGLSVSLANADCTCRAPGLVAHHGQTVCLRTPDGLRLARCEMVLNNSSWTFLPEACPQASLPDGGGTATAMSTLHAPAGVAIR